MSSKKQFTTEQVREIGQNRLRLSSCYPQNAILKIYSTLQSVINI